MGKPIIANAARRNIAQVCLVALFGLLPHWLYADNGGADQFSGNQWYFVCKAKGDDIEAYCTATITWFLYGHAHGWYLATGGSAVPYCIPDGIVGDQLRDVVLKFLADHPEQRHKAMSDIILSVMVGAFGTAPCKK